MNRPQSEKVILCQSQDIADGWRRVRFGDVAKKVNNIIDRKSCDLTRYVAGEHMQTDDFRIKKWGTVGDGYLGPAFNHKFTQGQILYGSRRTYLRKVSIPHFDGICANTTFVIEPTGENLIPELLPFVMQSASFNEHSVKMSKGSTNPYINWKDIACYEFCIPDKSYQQRIATLLWAAEDCIVKNERFIEEAERAKQVLMRELFSKGISKSLCYWEWRSISKLCKLIADCPHSTPKFVDSGVLVIRNFNVKLGRLDLSNPYYTSESEYYSRIKNARPMEGDILFSREAPCGEACIVPPKLPLSLGQRMMLLRVDSAILDPGFLLYALYSESVQKQINANSIGQTVTRMNVADIKKLKIHVPPLNEQRQIAGILTYYDKTIDTAIANVTAIKALKMKLINQFFLGV